MSFWVGFAKAKGLGQKKVYVTDLTYGTGAANNISHAVYNDTTGILVTIPELEKVDFAIVNIKSSAVLQDANQAVLATVQNYSANLFNIKLLGALSGVTSGLQEFAGLSVSGIEVSGYLTFQAFVVGEGKKETD